MSYVTKFDCKNRKGFSKSGKKVTGIEFLENCSSEALVTTNDSRLRLINLDNFKMKLKYKGHQNKNLQIRASMTEEGDYIICGSEDGNLYIWERESAYIPNINPKYPPLVTVGLLLSRGTIMEALNILSLSKRVQ